MSGVYIPGMEMPKPGRYEAVIIVLDKSPAKIAISPAEDDIGYWKEYSLVPVPPHGDLIDRNKLREKEFVRDGDAYAVVMSRDIRNAPTIIPADKEEVR